MIKQIVIIMASSATAVLVGHGWWRYGGWYSLFINTQCVC